MKQKKNLFTIIALIIFAIALIVGAIITLSKGGNKDIQEKLDLGQNYLDELKYEQALASYMAVLEIDPNNAEAYLGIVEVYIRTGDFETAQQYAQKGYDTTGDATLLEKLEMLKSGNISDSLGRERKRSNYDGEGKLTWWHIYEYDAEGQLCHVTAYDAEGNVTNELDVDNDLSDGITVAYIIAPKTGMLRKRVTYHDYAENVKKQEIYQESGEYTGYILIEYGNDGLMVGEKKYNNEEELYYEASYKYEFEKTATGEIRRDYCKDTDVPNWYLDAEYIYDQNGNMEKRTNYNVDGTIYRVYFWQYDSKGNTTGQKTYDGEGNLISETKNE